MHTRSSSATLLDKNCKFVEIAFIYEALFSLNISQMLALFCHMQIGFNHNLFWQNCHFHSSETAEGGNVFLTPSSYDLPFPNYNDLSLS